MSKKGGATQLPPQNRPVTRGDRDESLLREHRFSVTHRPFEILALFSVSLNSKSSLTSKASTTHDGSTAPWVINRLWILKTSSVTSTFPIWVILRFVAGVMSAWTLVAASAWGLARLASSGHDHLAGAIFAGVGLGIAIVGIYCLEASQWGISTSRMWIEVALGSGFLILFPWIVSARFPVAPVSVDTAPSTPAFERSRISNCGLEVCYGLFGFGYILPATYLPAMARDLINDPKYFGWAWPLFGVAAACSAFATSWGLRQANRTQVWSVANVLMTVGVLLSATWNSIASLALAAVLVGGTFLVITMVAMQEARIRAESGSTVVLARMTASFALGQLAGPVFCALAGSVVPNAANALHYGLILAATGLFLSAIYLWRES